MNEKYIALMEMYFWLGFLLGGLKTNPKDARKSLQESLDIARITVFEDAAQK